MTASSFRIERAVHSYRVRFPDAAVTTRAFCPRGRLHRAEGGRVSRSGVQKGAVVGGGFGPPVHEADPAVLVFGVVRGRGVVGESLAAAVVAFEAVAVVRVGCCC